MARRIWPFGLGILLCSIFTLILLLLSPVGAEEYEDLVYLPVLFGNSPAKEPIDQGLLEFEDLVINSLAENTTHRWTMHLLAGEMVTVSVAPGNTADIKLSLLDKDGLIHEQNLNPPGEVETIADLSIAESGQYELLVQAVGGQATDYALMLLGQDSYNFVLRGTLQDNDSRDDSLPAETDQFWFFNALSGETVSFTITPAGSGDPYIEFYDPHAARILTLDVAGEGEPESLENYALLATGLYAIRVGEFNFTPMDYQITISKP